MKELHQLVKWWTVWSIYNSLLTPTPQHLPDVPTPYHTIIAVRHPLLSLCKVGRNTSLTQLILKLCKSTNGLYVVRLCNIVCSKVPQAKNQNRTRPLPVAAPARIRFGSKGWRGSSMDLNWLRRFETVMMSLSWCHCQRWDCTYYRFVILLFFCVAAFIFSGHPAAVPVPITNRHGKLS